ncbi:two-component regulator propeller domain-containing protein [Lewinella cohaerens]|uniref:type IX secretion system anionic LPS delivery protein PorZ n=1 Tax=Lewinella cohaerens TaxID=70995 RepID=UPI0003A73BE8|nr:two-component regulator propeller domain-containing protein [Lewinella cohaerens]
MKPQLLLAFFLLPLLAFSQNILPIGEWRAHPPKRVGLSVTQSADQIFYTTRAALMILDKDEIAPKFKTTVDGLTGVDFRMIRFHEPSGKLIIVYDDGIIDLYDEGEIVTVRSIKNFTNITGEKTINDIFEYDANTLFLAGSYGVSAFRVDNGSFPFTTFMGEANVLSVAVFEGNIYAGTGEGIYQTPVSNPTADDFSTWNFLGTEAGFPDDYSTSAMTIYEGELYLGINEDIYRWENGGPVLFSDQTDNYGLRYLSAEGEHLLAGYRCVDGGCGNGQVLYFKADGSGGALTPGCIGRSNYAIEDQYGQVWFGDEYMGFRWLDNTADDFCNTFEINSPYSQKVWDLEVYDDTLWLAAGAHEPNRTPIPTDHGMASLANGDWEIYNRWSKEAFKGFNTSDSQRDDDVFALIDVVKNTTNGKVYGASYYTGLIEIDGENIRLFNDSNSPLSNTSGDDSRTRVSGLAVDDEGGLWVSNYRALEGKPLHRLNPDGTWVSFAETCGQNDLFQIAIDPSTNYKWIISGSTTSGVLLFDEGELDNPNDDRCRSFTANNSNVPTNETNCLAIDQDGDVWVGTNQGIVIFECGSAAFDDNCQGSLRTVDLDGFLEYLFKTQTVQAIAVDGANRKWVGTTNGAYLLSPDGKEELIHFTKDDSPLLDNSIRTIAINDRTGEVFFGTDEGVISYQGDAIVGTRLNNAEPTVFPNPVRPEYDGPITVRGLAVNANVKITDVNGKLVYETEALGGQAVWDGRDYNGRRVQTGVYLVFSTTNPREAGLAQPDAVVTKILFVN